MDTFIRLLGANIRNARKNQGLSQQKLGEKAGFDYRYIGFIEQARVNPTIKTLEKVATALDLPLKELFPKKSELETGRREPSGKISEREKIIASLTKNLDKADIEDLKALERIIKITVDRDK